MPGVLPFDMSEFTANQLIELQGKLHRASSTASRVSTVGYVQASGVERLDVSLFGKATESAQIMRNNAYRVSRIASELGDLYDDVTSAVHARLLVLEATTDFYSNPWAES